MLARISGGETTAIHAGVSCHGIGIGICVGKDQVAFASRSPTPTEKTISLTG